MDKGKLGLGALALLLVALVVALVVAVVAGLRPSSTAPAADTSANRLPWQVDVLPDGNSRVFGLTVGKSRLEDARSSIGRDLQVAVLTSPTAPPALEAYYERVQMGFITGRLILTATLPPEQLTAMAQGAAKTTPLPSGARKAVPTSDDRAQAWQATITGVSFVPSVDLDENTVLARFGEPAERLRSAEGAEHFLYPAIGLDLVLDPAGKELLQYVAPRDFARLRQPLLAAGQRL
jgi:hypothetical protein